MELSMIVAAATNNAIGKDNKLLWHLPNDMKFFKNTTWAMPVIMGRKTFESLSGKPLSGRLNIVITRQQSWEAAGVVVVHSLQDAIFVAESAHYKEAFVIGGGEIYQQAFHKADHIYLTRVHAVLEGDSFFPELDTAKWQKVSDQPFPADNKHAYPYSFQRWDRR
ncbi:MAG: dihydrofolate reductase [Chitinophagaceae bacterium]|nr:dihydrofolate reductase [Chitinophagaceae bacterium]